MSDLYGKILSTEMKEEIKKTSIDLYCIDSMRARQFLNITAMKKYFAGSANIIDIINSIILENTE